MVDNTISGPARKTAIEALKNGDLDYLNKMAGMGIDLVPSFVSGKELVAHATTKSFEAVLTNPVLYHDIGHPWPRKKLLSALTQEGRRDLFEIYADNGGLDELDTRTLYQLNAHDGIYVFIPRSWEHFNSDSRPPREDSERAKGIMGKLVERCIPPPDALANDKGARMLLAMSFWAASVETTLRLIFSTNFPVQDLRLGEPGESLTYAFSAIPSNRDKLTLLQALVDVGMPEPDDKSGIRVYVADRPPGITVDRHIIVDKHHCAGYD